MRGVETQESAVSLDSPAADAQSIQFFAQEDGDATQSQMQLAAVMERLLAHKEPNVKSREVKQDALEQSVYS